jgi:hypothetical protein
MFRNAPAQDVAAGGIRHLCVSKKLWDSYPVDETKLGFYDYEVKYANPTLFPKISESYEKVARKMAKYCTCGGPAAYMLNGIDPYAVEDVQIYTQCPIAKMLCLRKVLNQRSVPLPPIANRFFNFYKKRFHEKMMAAAEKYFYITPREVFQSIKTFAKQLEVIPYYNKDVINALYKLSGSYTQHNKQEIQTIMDKVRMICNPEAYSKWLTLLFEKPIRSIMYEVFGHQYGVGLSNGEKAFEITEMLKKKFNFTLDCSGFDNSHNKYLRQPWDFFISELSKRFTDRLESTILPQIFCNEYSKQRSKVNYEFMINKKIVTYATVDIGDKLASGSVYTTAINTFTMLLLIAFALEEDATNENTVSGDDALGSSDQDKNYIGQSLYSVYGIKGNNFFNNLGIILKYCYISNDPCDATPCSLDTFICPYCGPKLVRHFFKYVRDTFVSINYEKKFKNLGITQNEFEQLVYEGEMAWAKGLDFPMILFSPLNHGLKIQDVCNKISQILKNRTIARMNLNSSYTGMLEQFNQIMLESSKDSQKALRVMALLSGSGYIKMRDQNYCQKCSFYYDEFLMKKYGIDSSIIAPFYKYKREKKILYDGQVRVIDSRYLPYPFIKQAKLKYQKHLESLNYAIERTEIVDNMASYYMEKIKNLPETIFEFKPDSLEKRFEEITTKWLNLTKVPEPFELIMKYFSKYKCVFCTLYGANKDLDFQEPITEEELYAKGNKYYRLKIRGVEMTLEAPEFTRSKLNVNKKKKSVKIDAYRNMIKQGIQNDKEILMQIIKGSRIPMDPEAVYVRREMKLPPIEIPTKFKSITHIKNLMITMKRFDTEMNTNYYSKNLINLQAIHDYILDNPDKKGLYITG